MNSSNNGIEDETGSASKDFGLPEEGVLDLESKQVKMSVCESLKASLVKPESKN